MLWSCIPGVDMCCGICLFAAVFIAVKAATHEEPPKPVGDGSDADRAGGEVSARGASSTGPEIAPGSTAD